MVPGAIKRLIIPTAAFQMNSTKGNISLYRLLLPHYHTTAALLSWGASSQSKGNVFAWNEPPILQM